MSCVRRRASVTSVLAFTVLSSFESSEVCVLRRRIGIGWAALSGVGSR